MLNCLSPLALAHTSEKHTSRRKNKVEDEDLFFGDREQKKEKEQKKAKRIRRQHQVEHILDACRFADLQPVFYEQLWLLGLKLIAELRVFKLERDKCRCRNIMQRQQHPCRRVYHNGKTQKAQ